MFALAFHLFLNVEPVCDLMKTNNMPELRQTDLQCFDFCASVKVLLYQ